MAESISNRFQRFLKCLGPGVVAGAADDDPSGIATYTVAGAKFGTAFLWVALLTWPLMYVVQMTCARIGMVTGEGLASALERKVPRKLLLLFCGALFIANTLNVGADLSAMADAMELLGAGDSSLYVILFAAIISWATVRLHYRDISRVLKWLALFLVGYIATAFLIQVDWRQTLWNTFVPRWPRSGDEWGVLVAILGTTISPYLFFWQSSQEVEEAKAHGLSTVAQRIGLVKPDFESRSLDVATGTFASNLVMYFIILTSAMTLNRHGLINIESSAEAAQALKPIAGRFAALLYTVGLVGTGLLAIPTLTGSIAYAAAETFGWDQGLDAPLKQARAFYGVILVSTLIGVVFDFVGINPITALYWSAVVNGLLAPFLLLAILFVVSDTQIMRGNPSSWRKRLLLGLTTALMFAAAVGMFIF